MIKDVLKIENIVTNQPSESRIAAIERAGQMLVDSGYVTPHYVEGMIKRDDSLTTAIGNLIAIPHGESEYRPDIIKSGISVITYPQGIDWNGTIVKFVVGIAGKGEEHMEVLENIAINLESEDDVVKLVTQASRSEIYDFLTKQNG